MVAYLPLYKNPGQYFYVNFIKGAVVALTAHLLVGTPMALIVSGFGLLAGNLWFPLFSFKRKDSLFGTVSGILLFMAPDLFLLLFFWGVFLYLLQHWAADEILASFYLILPFLMFLTGKSDVYILFSVLVFLIIFLNNLELMEKGVKSLN